MFDDYYLVWGKTLKAKNLKSLKEVVIYSVIDNAYQHEYENNGCFYDTSYLAKTIKSPEEDTRKIIDKLEEKGLVRKIKRKDETGEEIQGYRTNRENLKY